MASQTNFPVFNISILILLFPLFCLVNASGTGASHKGMGVNCSSITFKERSTHYKNAVVVKHIVQSDMYLPWPTLHTLVNNTWIIHCVANCSLETNVCRERVVIVDPAKQQKPSFSDTMTLVLDSTADAATECNLPFELTQGQAKSKMTFTQVGTNIAMLRCVATVLVTIPIEPFFTRQMLFKILIALGVLLALFVGLCVAAPMISRGNRTVQQK